MIVCDICKKEINFPVKVCVNNILLGEVLDLGKKYELCPHCAMKIKKYIRYEQTMAQKRKEKTK